MIAISDLVMPRDKAAWKAILVQSLKGISPVRVDGPGLGSIVASGVGKVDAHVLIKIATDGDVGAGEYQLSTDGGISYAAAATIPVGKILISTTGAMVQFSDSTISTPAFRAGTVYSFWIGSQVIKYTAWQKFTVGGRFLDLHAESAEDLDKLISSIASGGYGSTAKGAWLDLWLGEMYQETRVAAQSTLGTVRLSDAGGGPWSIGAGEVLVANDDNSIRFMSTEAAELPLNGEIPLRVQAELAGSDGNLPNGSITAMVSAFPGITVTNPARVDAVIKGRAGSPDVMVTGDPNSDYALFIEFTSATLWKWSLDGGLTFEATGLSIPGTPYTLSTSGLVAEFEAGTYQTGDTFDCAASVSWISTAGSEAESDEDYFIRATQKWATLAVGQPDDALEKWAKDASAEVTRVFVRASQTTPGEIDIIIAGAAGQVSATALAAVDAALQPLTMLPAVANVANAGGVVIDLVGSVYVASPYWDAAQAGVASAAQAYIASVLIGGVKIDSGLGIVSIDALKGAIASVPGVLDLDLTPTDDVSLTWNTVATLDISGITFVKVA